MDSERDSRVDSGNEKLPKRIVQIALVAGACLLVASSANAQSADHRDLNYAIGFGVGLARVEQRGVFYLNGNFRFNWWDRDEDDDLRTTLESGGRSRMKGFLEAEVGYWKDSDLTPFESDLLIGLNVIGVLPTRAVDFYFGGGVGAHFLKASPNQIVDEEAEIFSDETRFGANVQFGVDINFTDPVGIFAEGRYDLLQGEILDFQAKVLFGARYRF